MQDPITVSVGGITITHSPDNGMNFYCYGNLIYRTELEPVETEINHKFDQCLELQITGNNVIVSKTDKIFIYLNDTLIFYKDSDIQITRLYEDEYVLFNEKNFYKTYSIAHKGSYGRALDEEIVEKLKGIKYYLEVG